MKGRPRGPIPPTWISEVKSALPLRETIERLAKVKFDRADGHQAKACCPFHQERTPSFFVNERTGRYRCYGASCGKHGDVIQFIADWHSLTFREAIFQARELAGLPTEWDGRAARKPTLVDSNRAMWRKTIPPPPLRSVALKAIPDSVDLPRPGEWVTIEDEQRSWPIRIKPTHIHVYRNEQNYPLCLVLRSPTQKGGKFFVQTGWRAGCWKLIRFPGLRPIYGLEDMPEWCQNRGEKILIVEGETTREAAAKLLPLASTGYLSLTTMGGGNAINRADWQPLVKRLAEDQKLTRRLIAITVWPDADLSYEDQKGHRIDPQLAYFNRVKASLMTFVDRYPSLANSLTFSRVKPPKAVPKGWDIADAMKECWSGQQLLSWISQSTVTRNDPEYPSHGDLTI